jgi:CDP-paratose synthetase
MPKGKSILLTGATGFLGHHLLEALVKKSYSVVILKRSTSNPERIVDFAEKIKTYDVDKCDLTTPFKENQIDLVCHTSTNYGRHLNLDFDVIQSNLIFPLQLLEMSIEHGVGSFINTDTFYKPDQTKLKLYALSKNQFANLLETFSPKIKSVNFELEHVYGENDSNAKLIPFVINTLLNNNQQLSLGSGKQQRDFIYVEDVVSAYLEVIANIESLPSQFVSIPIGTGKMTSVKELVLMLRDICKNSATVLDFDAITEFEGELEMSKADLESTQRILNWSPRFSLSDGLEKTVNWFRKHK